MGIKTWMDAWKPFRSTASPREQRDGLFVLEPGTSNCAFMHIGKTGGTSVSILMRALRERGYDTPAKLGHRATLTRMAEEYPNLQLSMILRDPLERVISGFNSRLRQGRPVNNNLWTTDEAVAFSHFRSVDCFLRAILSGNEYEKSAVAFAMAKVKHLARGYQFYFRDPDFVKANKGRFYFIGDIREMRSTLTGILPHIPPNLIDEIYEKAHVAKKGSTEILQQFNEDQIQVLQAYITDEYRIYHALLEIRNAHHLQENYVTPGISG